MLAGWVFTVWGAWVGALGLASVLTGLRVWNPDPILPVGLAVVMFVAGVGLLIAATVRLIRGPQRSQALAGLLAGTAPFIELTSKSHDELTPPSLPQFANPKYFTVRRGTRPKTWVSY
jgi:hypothetical protein